MLKILNFAYVYWTLGKEEEKGFFMLDKATFASGATILASIGYCLCCTTAAAADSPYFQKPYMWSKEESRWTGSVRMGGMFTGGDFPDMPLSDEEKNFDGDFVNSSVFIEGEVKYNFTDYVAVAAGAGYIPQQQTTVMYNTGKTSEQGEQIVTSDQKARFHMFPVSASILLYPLPYGGLRPYLGGGAYYGLIRSGYDLIEFDNPSGFFLRGGVDWWTEMDLGINFDVRWYDMKLDTDMSKFGVANGKGSIDMNPVTVSAGVNYRF